MRKLSTKNEFPNFRYQHKSQGFVLLMSKKINWIVKYPLECFYQVKAEKNTFSQPKGYYADKLLFFLSGKMPTIQFFVQAKLLSKDILKSKVRFQHISFKVKSERICLFGSFDYTFQKVCIELFGYIHRFYINTRQICISKPKKTSVWQRK